MRALDLLEAVDAQAGERSMKSCAWLLVVRTGARIVLRLSSTATSTPANLMLLDDDTIGFLDFASSAGSTTTRATSSPTT